jgi:nucleoside-diphosphate-sugar epimerase
VLITGATGRLGRHVLAALLARREKVRAVVRPGSRHSLPRGVERFEWDLSSAKLPAKALEGVDRVIHLAGLVGSHPASQLMLSNAVATRNLASPCPQHAIRKLVIASSISVYGEYAQQLVNEEFEPRAESPYGKSKLAAEQEALAHRRGIPLALLRFGMIYGPGFEQGYFDVLRLLERGKMRVFGNGENRLPLLHVDDAVAAVLLALRAPILSSRAYNIVGSERPTQEEVLGTAARELGVQPPSRLPIIFVQSAHAISGLLSALGMADPLPFDEENLRQLTLDRMYSAERARRELGFEAKVKLEDGIKQMVREYRGKGKARGRAGKRGMREKAGKKKREA